MKQVININFHGTVVPIETTAYDMLRGYIESLNKHFANEEGKEEIINDIESRIAELFQDRLKKGATCITDEDVNAIIDNMGRVEDFEKEETGADQSQKQTSTSFVPPAGNKRLYRDDNNKVLGGVCSGLASYFNIDVVIVRIIFVVLLFSGIGFLTYIIMWIAVPSSASMQIGGPRRKLYRDTDDKLLAGVCSGIGNYFGINPWIPRVLFLIPFISLFSRWGNWGGFWDFGDVIRFTFSPTSLIVYIILWIVIPEALTTSEKLAMKGEKVDLDSIKNSVMEEMKTVGKKAQSYGKEIAGTVTEKASDVAGDVQQFAKRGRTGLGDVIAMIVKIFVYFIIGCMIFALVMALIGLGIFSIGIFPHKDFLLHSGAQNAYAWGTLLFFIVVPIVAIITWLIRKITRSKANSRILALSFGALWTIGWVCFILLLSSVSRDFKFGSNLDEQAIELSNPTINKLVVTSSSPFNKKYYQRNWTRFEPFENLAVEDTAYVRNIDVVIAKSKNDSFGVTVLRKARGNNRADANTLAGMIEFDAKQLDSLLVLDKGIAITKKDKFRNQSILVTIYVPVGKQIKIKRGINWPVHFYRNNDWRFDSDEDNYESGENQRWQTDVDYIMKADGLYTLSGRKADGWNDRKENNRPANSYDRNRDDNYRYNEYDRKADSLRTEEERKQQMRKDSIDREIQRLENLKEQKAEQTDKSEKPDIVETAITPDAPGLNILTQIL